MKEGGQGWGLGPPAPCALLREIITSPDLRCFYKDLLALAAESILMGTDSGPFSMRSHLRSHSTSSHFRICSWHQFCISHRN